jgi:hypothetical protein
MREKTWSYKEVTEEAEQRIVSLLKEVRHIATQDQKLGQDYIAHAHAWAYGVFLGWNHLTLGYQDPSDVVRLEALAMGSASVR